MTTILESDVVDRLAGLDPDSALGSLRQSRDEVRSATQGSFDALFEAEELEGLPQIEREQVALRVATQQGNLVLASFHRERLRALGAPASGDQSSTRWQAIATFADRLALAPFDAMSEHLAPLLAQKLTPTDVVTLSQLIAFVSYQTRVLAGLNALKAHPVDTSPTPLTSFDATAHYAGTHGKVEHHHATVAYTTNVLEWKAWLATVNPERASPDQAAVLDESHSSARTSPYYLTLVHNPRVLRQRSRLFNAIMYGQGGLSRAERELTTVAVSLVNGCPYCASVHARFFVQLAKQPEVIDALYQQGVDTPLIARQRALIDLGVELSRDHPVLQVTTLQHLRGSDLSEQQILDAVHAAAIFAWANRLMQTLGEPVAAD